MSTNGNGTVWKWLSTTMGGLLIGVVIASGVDSYKTERLVERVVAQGQAIAVVETKVEEFRLDIVELRQLLMDIAVEMRRLHSQGE